MALGFNKALSTAAKKLTFRVGSSSFNIGDATEVSASNAFQWSNSGLSWTVGGKVSLSLVEPAADTAPGKPTGLSASANGTTQIDLSWTAPSATGGQAISGYRVEVSSDGGTTWSDLEDDTESTTTTHSHTGLSAGTTRHYRVSAINSVGTGAASDTASATTPTPTAPGKPTGLSASANGAMQIDLSWTAPSDTGNAAISGYRVEVAQDSDNVLVFSELEDDTESTSTTYSHTGLSAGTTRHYRVSAINSVGTGAASDSASATTVTPTAPGKPTGLSASANGATQIDLSWTAPSDTGNAAISGYRVEASSDGGTNFSDLAADTGSTTTTYAHTGLSGGTTRHYRVSAINSVGTGSASTTASATTATLAGKPTGLSASRNGGTRIDLSWTAPSVTGSTAISGYKVEVSSDSGTTWSDLVANTASTTTTYAHTGLSASTARHYRVSAITSVGTGAASGTASATTAADATVPTITSVAVTGSDVTLQFSEALDTASRPPSSAFTLTAKAGGVTRTISGKTSRANVYGINGAVSLVASASKDEELTLSYTAPATNPLQDTAGNDMASFSGMSAQNVSTSTQRPARFSADTARFSIAEDHADAATVGTVTASDSDGDTLTYTLASGGDNDSFSIGSGTGVIRVKSGVQLDHEAKASHALTAQVSDGQDLDGNPAAVDDTLAVTVTVTNVEEPPGAPSAVVVSTTDAVTLAVRWSAPADVGAGVEGYTLRYRVSGGQWTSEEAGAVTEAVLGGLTPSTAYEVQVRAHGDGAGPWSGSGNGTTAAAATTPTVPRFVGGTSASFSLDAPLEDAARVGRVVASDADGDTLRYSLAPGGDSDSFTIDNTGLIRVRAGEVLAADTRYTVTARITDGEDANGDREARPAIDDTLTVSIAVAGPAEDAVHHVSLVPPASHPLHLGLVRVVNRSAEAGEVSILAIDDEGAEYGPLTLGVEANAVAHFNSRDLEEGNPDRLAGSTGAGQGSWRLELRSALDIEVYSFVRSDNGVLARMHDLVAVDDAGVHRVGFFNPASNQGRRSGLRLINPGAEAAAVRVEGIDDAGVAGESAVELSLGAGVSRTLYAPALESGEGEGLSGALGDGQGKWRLRVSADRPIRVMSLLLNPGGQLINMSIVPVRSGAPPAE